MRWEWAGNRWIAVGKTGRGKTTLMACQECEFAELGVGKDVYVRIGNGDVRVIGCDKHIKELIAIVRFARSAKRNEREHVGPNQGGGEHGNSTGTS